MKDEDVNLYIYERWEYGEDDELPDCYKNPEPLVFDEDYDLATPRHNYPTYTPQSSCSFQRNNTNENDSFYGVAEGTYGTTEDNRKSFERNCDPTGLLSSIGINYDNIGFH